MINIIVSNARALRLEIEIHNKRASVIYRVFGDAVRDLNVRVIEENGRARVSLREKRAIVCGPRRRLNINIL